MNVTQIREIAHALKGSRPRYENHMSEAQYARYEQWGKDVVAVSKALKRTDMRFQFTKFYMDCGYLGDSSSHHHHGG